MIDNINKLSSNLDTNKQQQTAASIVNLTDDDVVKIWDAVSAYIESYMKQSKGVTIPGFGTFTFIHKRTDVGNNKYLLIQRPVFVFSEKFAQTHALKFTRYPVNGAIPIHPLNYFYIQTQSTYSRDQIEQCVKHVLQVFNRSVAGQRNVEFTFTRIGKLQIRDGKVKMKFFKDFVNEVDGNTGKSTFDNTCNRPQTSDSVMSEREAARPPTASNVVLPRINSRIGNPSMQVIQEENQADDEQQVHRTTPIKRRDPSSCKNDLNRSGSRAADYRLPPLIETAREPTISLTNITTQPSANAVTTTGVTSSQDGVIPIASLFSSSDLGQPSPTATSIPSPPKKQASTSGALMRRSPPTYQDRGQTPSNPSNGIVIRATSETSAALGFTRPMTDRSTRDRISSALNVYPQNYQHITSGASTPSTPCGHHGAGQELCYLCHQRAKRNIPIYLHEERRIREAEEAKLLEQYQHNRDLDEQRKQEANIKADREDRQRIAAYNLGIAEATRAKKMERPTTAGDVVRSFVFRKRIQTPPTYIRQQDLAKQLDAQIRWKQDEERTEKQEKDFVERLEQIQLAEALAQERETYLRNKRLQQEELKTALDNQIRNKSNGISAAEITAPYFGLNDMTTDKLKERRLKAMEIFRQQKEVVEQRQRQQLLKQIREQEYESRALDAVKEDLLSDQRERFHRAYAIRKDLETDWSNASTDKYKRDQDERMHIYAPQGVLVHEQCDQYKRCAQCQRNLKNYGTSNVWKDTRYIPGTRIMV